MQPAIIPLTADLNANGTDTPGIYNTSSAEFTFDGKTVRFGLTTDIPITGDWDGDGYDEIGVFRPKVEGFDQSTFYLVTRNWADLPYEVGAADKTIPFGYYPDDIPVAGDWDGDGDDDIGGYYPANSTFYLYLLNLDSSTAISFKAVPFGVHGDTPLTGDWDWDGDDDAGVYRAFDPDYSNNPAFYFDLNHTGGQADYTPYPYGNNGDIPVTGSWNGDGDSNIGVYRPSTEEFFFASNIPPTLRYLDNGVIKVGVSLDWGGAISEISHQGFNLIDDHDAGRLAQVAFYDNSSAWNPVQGGDIKDKGSPVLDYTVQPNLIYTKTQPRDWNTGELADVYVEQWVSLDGEAVKVNYKMTHLGTDVHTFHNQEFPCAYVNKSLYRCITYNGSEPWTNDTVVEFEIPQQSPGSANAYFYPTEFWASFVNDHDFGLTLYSKDHTAKWAANRFDINTQPGYLATVDEFSIEPGTVEVATEYYIVANYPDARSKVYSLEQMSGWQYNRNIYLKENSGNNLTDYPVLINLSGDNFPSEANESGADIRFVNEYGNVLNYWIEEYNYHTKKARIWVKVPEIHANDTITLQMYWGNSGAIAKSNGSVVFEFFDDFSANTIAGYDTKCSSKTTATCGFDWDSTNKYLVVSCLGGDCANYAAILYPKDLNLKDLIASCDFKVVEQYDPATRFGILTRYQSSSKSYKAVYSTKNYVSPFIGRYTDEGLLVIISPDPNANGKLWDWKYRPTSAEYINTNTWYNMKFAVWDNNQRLFLNDIEKLSCADSNITTNGSIGFKFAENKGWIDNIIIRKYTSPEPTVTFSVPIPKPHGFFVTGGSSGNVYVFPSYGNGSFADKELVGNIGSNCLGSAIADFDNDGDLDFTIESGNGDSDLFINDGTGGFAQTKVAEGLSLSKYSGESTTADFNKDGYYDYVVSSSGAYIYLFTNNGNNTFSKSTISADWFVTGSGLNFLSGIDTGDFNEDGNMDFLIAEYREYGTDLVYTYTGNGDGTFTYKFAFDNTDYNGGDTVAVVAGDFDNDGHCDAIVGQDDDGEPGQTWLYKGDDTGKFTYSGEAYDTNPSRESGSEYSGQGYADAYDFDGDGNLDVVASAHIYGGGDSGTFLFKGNGDGTFWASVKMDEFIGCGISAPPLEVKPEILVFDTGSSNKPYPSISGTHNGTITPSQAITVQKLYTYPCTGTGGHTEYARIWNSFLDTNATWNGYTEDWHNITFNKSFTLAANETYNYTIITGSYPQIIHKPSKEVTGGTINCTVFVDANGKKYNDWIPAIRLWSG